MVPGRNRESRGREVRSTPATGLPGAGISPKLCPMEREEWGSRTKSAELICEDTKAN